MSSKQNINDEIVNGDLIFYHSAKSLEAYKYLLEDRWRTSSGHYGHALYGNFEALWEDNFSHTGSPTDQNRLYGDFRFRVKALRPYSLLFCNVKDGAKILAGYSADVARVRMEDHGVPKDMIDSIMSLINGRTYASNTALRPSSNASEGTLLKYGFNGFVYDGNLDGKTVVFYNPKPTNVLFTGVSFDKGKTFMDIPTGTNYQQFLNLVDAFRNPTKRVASKRTTSGGSTVGLSLLPPSVMKYMDRGSTRSQFEKMKDLSESYYQGKQLSANDIIFVESWYIRFNLTHRRSVHPHVSGDAYPLYVLVSYIVAFSCVDSKSPLSIHDTYKNLDHKRFISLIFPFSIKNSYTFHAWASAFTYLNLDPSFRPVLVAGSSTKPVLQLGRVVAAYFEFLGSYGINILERNFDLLNKRFKSDYGHEVDYYFSELNSSIPEDYEILAGSDSLTLGYEVEEISSAGVLVK